MRKIVSSAARHPLLKGFGVYFGTSIVNRAIPFLLIPVLTRYLTPGDYGTLGLFQALAAFLLPVVGMNLHANVTRNFYRVDRATTARITFNALAVLLAAGLIVWLAVALAVLSDGPTFGIPAPWILILPVLAVTNMASELNLAVLRNEQRALAFAGFEVSRTVLDLGLTLVLVVGLAYGWQGRASGIVVASVAVAVAGLVRLGRSGLIRPEIDGRQLRSILAVSLPLVPHALGGASIAFADRLFVERMLGVEAVGIYTVGYQFGMIMQLVVVAFGRTWSPWFYRLMAGPAPANERRIVRASYAAAVLLLVVAGLVTAGAHVALPLMTPTPYHAATGLVGWIAFGFAFFGMYTLMHAYAVHAGRTAFLGVTTVAAAMLNLGLNYVLIRLNGAVGAAQATLVAYALMLIFVGIYAQRIHPMPWLGSDRASRR